MYVTICDTSVRLYFENYCNINFSINAVFVDLGHLIVMIVDSHTRKNSTYETISNHIEIDNLAFLLTFNFIYLKKCLTFPKGYQRFTNTSYFEKKKPISILCFFEGKSIPDLVSQSVIYSVHSSCMIDIWNYQSLTAMFQNIMTFSIYFLPSVESAIFKFKV